MNGKWERLKSSITEAAAEVIPKVEKSQKQKWIIKDILDMMDKRRKAKRQTDEYERLHKEIRKRCNEAKETWINDKCQEIYLLQRFLTQTIYKNIEEITGRKAYSSNGCLKAKNGDIILDKDKIGPTILKDEVHAALLAMKNGKAPGLDGITVEHIETLEEFGIEKLTLLLNEVYDTGLIPSDMSKSIFIALPKKPGATECESHRTISLMSHVMKILLRIIVKRVRSKLKPEIAEEQCGFVEGKGTSNAVYLIRTRTEQALEVQKDVYLCFIDYTKAFDRVKQD